MRRFWAMLAHYHGQTWNASELAKSFDASQAIIRKKLDILTGAFAIRQLPAWYENLGKKTVKSPKIYLWIISLWSIQEKMTIHWIKTLPSPPCPPFYLN
jgi:predicted AAA+ superfamily ATPase